MLDLGKPYGTHEGLTFYGDHEDNRIVYYLPDEIKFAQKENGDPAVFLQMFQEEKIWSGGIEELRNTAGSILELDAVCTVDPERMNRAVKSLKEKFSLPDGLTPMPPLWKEGSVDLITLDGSKTGSDSTFVKKIVGTSRPSLGSPDLKSIFNIRFDRAGTELIYSAMKGGQGGIVGLMYDLQFPALRPSVQLRISADLNRCQETLRHSLDAGFQMTYYVDLSLNAQMDLLTKKMEDNGDIKVELLSLAETPEEKEIVNDLVKDFKESVIKELFEPVPDLESTVAVSSLSTKEIADLVKQGVSALSDLKKKDEDKKDKKDGEGDDKEANSDENSEANSDDKDKDKDKDKEDKLEDAKRYASAFHLGVTYQMIQHTIEVGRKIEVDYREKSTVIKRHNPSSHLWLMKKEGEEGFDKYITDVKLGTLWKDQEVKVTLLYNFEDPDSDLVTAEVIVWRAKDGIDEGYKGEGRAIRKSAVPLDSFTFSKNSLEDRQIAWLSDDEEDAGYYYQVHYIYSGSLLNVVSPLEIFTAPVLSYSRNLLIQPDRTLYYKKYPVRGGSLDFNEISNVEVHLSTVNPKTGKLNAQIIHLDKQHVEDRYIVRGNDKTTLPLEIEKVYYFKDGRNPVKSMKTLQVDDEIVVSDPVVEKEFVVVLSGIKEGVTDVLLNTSIESKEFDSMLSRTFCLSTANGALQTIKIPFYSNSDTVKYSSSALSFGKQIPLVGGVWTPEDPAELVVDLSTANQRKITLQWEGKSPDDMDLKYLSVVLKDAEGNEVKSHTFKGPAVPAPVEFTVDGSLSLTMDIERKYTDGDKDTDKGIPVDSGIIIIRP